MEELNSDSTKKPSGVKPVKRAHMRPIYHKESCILHCGLRSCSCGRYSVLMEYFDSMRKLKIWSDRID